MVLYLSERELEFNGFLPETTNNLAEYRAFLEAVRRAKALGVKKLSVYTDSELMAKQYKGEYQVNEPELKEALEAVKQEVGGLSLEVCPVPREAVKRAHRLAQKARQEGLSGERQSS